MKSLPKALLYGFVIWLIAFATAFLIFPLRESNRPFFESVMPVVLSVATVIFTSLYFKNVKEKYIPEGLLLGVIFVVVNWFIDALFMLTPSPMQMTLPEYFQDIGFTYLLIPPITIGFGLMLQHSQKIKN